MLPPLPLETYLGWRSAEAVGERLVWGVWIVGDGLLARLEVPDEHGVVVRNLLAGGGGVGPQLGQGGEWGLLARPHLGLTGPDHELLGEDLELGEEDVVVEFDQVTPLLTVQDGSGSGHPKCR